MSARATIEETPDGWDVYVFDADKVHVKTVGPRITVTIHADDDEPPATPLDVHLGQPK